MGDQIPQLSPHAEVRKIGDLTLYIAYENTWNLVQVKFPTLGTKLCIKSLGNAPPIPVLGGVGLNIDRCIKAMDLHILSSKLVASPNYTWAKYLTKS